MQAHAVLPADQYHPGVWTDSDRHVVLSPPDQRHGVASSLVVHCPTHGIPPAPEVITPIVTEAVYELSFNQGQSNGAGQLIGTIGIHAGFKKQFHV